VLVPVDFCCPYGGTWPPTDGIQACALLYMFIKRPWIGGHVWLWLQTAPCHSPQAVAGVCLFVDTQPLVRYNGCFSMSFAASHQRLCTSTGKSRCSSVTVVC